MTLLHAITGRMVLFKTWAKWMVPLIYTVQVQTDDHTKYLNKVHDGPIRYSKVPVPVGNSANNAKCLPGPSGWPCLSPIFGQVGLALLPTLGLLIGPVYSNCLHVTFPSWIVLSSATLESWMAFLLSSRLPPVTIILSTPHSRPLVSTAWQTWKQIKICE